MTFREGHEHLKDVSRSQQLSTAQNLETAAIVHEAVPKQCSMTKIMQDQWHVHGRQVIISFLKVWESGRSAQSLFHTASQVGSSCHDSEVPDGKLPCGGDQPSTFFT
jgi:hypothetical protein